MQSDSGNAGFLLKAVAILAALAVLYAGWKVLPLYLSNALFEGDVRSQARLLGGHEELSAALQDAIYRNAQRRGLPVQPDDIQVEYGPSGTRVGVNYTVTADLGFMQLPLHFHPHYPQPKQTFPPPERGFLGGIGLILGLYWFFKGFGIFREYMVVADTPLAPIRSVAMGRVQVHGKAVGEKTLRSPVSNQLCFLYKVNIDRFLAGRQGQGRWSPYLTDEGSVNFYLEDDTGKVLVDPEAAELELEEAYQCEVGCREIVPLDEPWRSDAPPSAPAGVPTPDSELRRYITRVAEGINSAGFQGEDLDSSLEAGSRQRQQRRGRKRGQGFPGNLIPSVGLDRIAAGAAPGDYRLTEYCIVPENEYDITGTCAINRSAGNQTDRQLITRGENDATFLISDKAEPGLERDLHYRAWRSILGGGLLAIGGAAVLLEAMGLLM
ncbi:MAG TPA: GIDE domain-containing protein [Terriglobia bacterium]|nr:GIDE domain-containing protein [Terriglobia bacterium]